MPMEVNIENVPVEVSDKLAAHAARQGLFKQEFLRCELKRFAPRPASEAWLHDARERKPVTGT